MGKRDLAGPRGMMPPPIRPGVRDGVVRRAEGPVRHQPLLRVEHPGHGVDLGGFERFLKAQRRQDGWRSLGQHGLGLELGYQDQEDVVVAGRGDFERALGHVLAAHVLEVPKGTACSSSEQDRAGSTRSGLAVIAPKDAEPAVRAPPAGCGRDRHRHPPPPRPRAPFEAGITILRIPLRARRWRWAVHPLDRAQGAIETWAADQQKIADVLAMRITP